MTIRSKYSAYERYATYIDPEGDMTQQEFKRECDINNIMAKYQRTGTIDHLNKYAGAYMDVHVQDYQEALEIIGTVHPMFADLPSAVREHFENEPAYFMEYVQQNGAEGVADLMRELSIEVTPPDQTGLNVPHPGSPDEPAE